MIAPYPEHMPAAADEEAEKKYELVKVIQQHNTVSQKHMRVCRVLA
jgi:hypothetical protein